MENGEISSFLYVYFDFASVLPVHLCQLSVVNIWNKNKCVKSDNIDNMDNIDNTPALSEHWSSA